MDIYILEKNSNPTIFKKVNDILIFPKEISQNDGKSFFQKLYDVVNKEARLILKSYNKKYFASHIFNLITNEYKVSKPDTDRVWILRNLLKLVLNYSKDNDGKKDGFARSLPYLMELSKLFEAVVLGLQDLYLANKIVLTQNQEVIRIHCKLSQNHEKSLNLWEERIYKRNFLFFGTKAVQFYKFNLNNSSGNTKCYVFIKPQSKKVSLLFFEKYVKSDDYIKGLFNFLTNMHYFIKYNRKMIESSLNFSLEEFFVYVLSFNIILTKKLKSNQKSFGKHNLILLLEKTIKENFKLLTLDWEHFLKVVSEGHKLNFSEGKINLLPNIKKFLMNEKIFFSRIPLDFEAVHTYPSTLGFRVNDTYFIYKSQVSFNTFCEHFFSEYGQRGQIKTEEGILFERYFKAILKKMKIPFVKQQYKGKVDLIVIKGKLLFAIECKFKSIMCQGKRNNPSYFRDILEYFDDCKEQSVKWGRWVKDNLNSIFGKDNEYKFIIPIILTSYPEFFELKDDMIIYDYLYTTCTIGEFLDLYNQIDIKKIIEKDNIIKI